MERENVENMNKKKSLPLPPANPLFLTKRNW